MVPDSAKLPPLPKSASRVALICPPANSLKVLALTSTAEADTVSYILIVGASTAAAPDIDVRLPALSNTVVLACTTTSFTADTDPVIKTLPVY